MRSTDAAPQEGHTSGFWSRSAAISISASGARYSLMPLRPTALPFRWGLVARNWLTPPTVEIYWSRFGRATYWARPPAYKEPSE